MLINSFNTVQACNVPGVLRLVDPFTNEIIIDENDNPLEIKVYGIQSDVVRNAIKERDRKYGKTENLTEAQKEQSGAEFLAAATGGWSDNFENDDGLIKFSFANAVELYKEQDWIARQVSKYMMDLRNYDPKRSKP